MMRKSRVIVLVCLLVPTGVAAAAAELATRSEAHLGSGPAARNSCSGTWCSTGLASIAATASAIFSRRPDGAQADGLGLQVAPVTRAEPATETRLQVQIGSRNPLPKNTLIRLRGLPTAVSVPQGHQVADGVWAVPVRALAELSLVVPDGLFGGSDVSVTLVTTDGELLAQSTTKLVVSQL